jgi:hypothetical protein
MWVRHLSTGRLARQGFQCPFHLFSGTIPSENPAETPTEIPTETLRENPHERAAKYGTLLAVSVGAVPHCGKGADVLGTNRN